MDPSQHSRFENSASVELGLIENLNWHHQNLTVVLSIEIPGEITFLHHLYIVSFSIFYAVMLHTLKGLHAFDTSDSFTGNPRALLRFATSVTLLNLLPFLHFSIILLYLLDYLVIDIFSILLVFALSISLFGFDKIFHAILIHQRKRLYSDSEFQSMINSSESLRKKFASHHLQHLVPGLLYILVPLGSLLLHFEVISGSVMITGSIAGSLVVWYKSRANTSPKIDERASP